VTRLFAAARVHPPVPTPVPPESVPTVVEEHLRTEEAALLEAVGAAADAAADARDPPGELERLLDEGGVTAHLPRALAGAVDAVGRRLRATPVADAPYVVVSGRGPLLRATLADGRLVVCLAVFEVERGPTYRRGEGVDVDAALR
jgi:hypothetical protein